MPEQNITWAKKFLIKAITEERRAGTDPETVLDEIMD